MNGILLIARVAINTEAISFVDFRHDGPGGNIAIHMGSSSITVPSESDDAAKLRADLLPEGRPVLVPPPGVDPPPAATDPSSGQEPATQE